MLFLCTDVEYWNGSRTTHGAPNMKGLSVLVLDKRKGRFAHIFWVSSGFIITLLLSICGNSIKINNALFDKKTSSATLWCIACFRLNLWEKEKYFGVGLPCNIQHNILDHMMFPTSVKL